MPRATYDSALSNAVHNKNSELLKFLLHSINHTQNDRSEWLSHLSRVFDKCLRANWSDPVDEYARHNPKMIPAIAPKIQQLGEESVNRFAPFLAYYENHLLTKAVRHAGIQRTHRKL